MSVSPLAVRDQYAGTALQPLVVAASSGLLVNDQCALQAQLVTRPLHGELTLSSNGGFTYTTFGNYGGTDQFTYRALADGKQSDAVVVTLQLTQQPNVPVAVNDFFTGAEDELLRADATPLRSVDAVSLQASQVVYDRTGQHIYALVGESVVPIDPITRQAGTPRTIGGGVSRIAISDDGLYIHAVTNDGRSLRRYNTQQDRVDQETLVGTFGQYSLAIGDLEPVPGRPAAVAVALYYPGFSPRQGGIVIVDNGVKLPASTEGGLGSSGGGDDIVFTGPTTLVGYTNSLSSYDVTIMQVDSKGVQVVSSTSGILCCSGGITGGSGYMYAGAGTVVQVEPLKNRGVLPQLGLLLADPELRRVFVLHGGGADTTVSWFDPATLKQIGTLELPEFEPNETVVSWTRFGSDGLALATDRGRILIVRSDRISGVQRKGVLTNDSDPEAQPLTPTLVTNVAHGVLTWAGDGTFTYQPERDFTGFDSFTYRVSDGTNVSNVAKVTLEVRPVNDAPVAVDDAYSMIEDGVLQVSAAEGILRNDRDVEGDRLYASVPSKPSHGKVVLQADGSFTYTPNADFAGEDSFTYMASDGAATSQPATVRIQVAKLNELPQAVPDRYAVNEDGVLRLDGSPSLSVQRVNIVVQDLAVDPTGQQLFATVPGNVLLELDPYTGGRRDAYELGRDPRQIVISDDGRYLYAAVEDDRALRVFDLQTKKAGARVLMPGSGDGAERIRELHAIPGSPDRVMIARTYRSISPPAAGSWVYTKDGEILPKHFGEGAGTGGADILAVDETGKLAYGYQNSISSFDFWYMNVDAEGLTVVDTAPWGSMLSGFNVGRIGVANGRLFSDTGVIMDLVTRKQMGTFRGAGNMLLEPATGRFFGLENSPQGNPTLYIYSLDTLQEIGKLEIPNAGSSTDSLVRFGTDGIAFRSGSTLVLVQSSVLSGVAPRGVLDNDRDIDAPGLVVELASGVSHGQLNLRADGQFTYQPNSEYSGTDQFQYRLALGDWRSPPTPVTIVVRPVNDRPITNPESYKTDEDAVLTVNAIRGVLANDSDVEGDPLLAVLAAPPAQGTLDLKNDGSFTYTPKLNFFGEDSFQYAVWDGENMTDPVTVGITVAAMPDASQPQPDAYVTPQAQPLIASSTVPVSTEPVTATLLPLKSTWKYLDDGSNQGTAWRDTTFDDSRWKSGNGEFGYGDGDEATVVEFGPNPNNRYITTYFRTTFEVGRLSELSNVQMQAFRDDGIAVYLNGVEIARELLQANAGYMGLATSGATDDGRARRTYNIPSSLLVEGDNLLAVEIHQATANSSDISFDGAVIATRAGSTQKPGVLVNDTDPDNRPLQAELVSPPAHGSLTLRPDGTFEYRPERTFTGTDRFEYRAGDGFGESTTAVVSIQVQPANVPPLAAADEYFAPYRAPLNVPAGSGVLANDSDLEPGTLVAQLVESTKRGTLELRADGSFTFTPGPSFQLEDRFTYRVSDGQLTSDTVEVRITVDAPTLVVGSHNLLPNQSNQKVPLYVRGGQRVGGVNLYVQSGDGGPELTQLGLPAGTRGPALTGIDLVTGTIFASTPDRPSVLLTLPQVGFATLAIAEPQSWVAAEGLLATLTVDTTGLFGGTYDLKLDQILPELQDGPFASDFGGQPVRINNGKLQIRAAQVTGRHVFYNRSKFDGDNAAADMLDDQAIAVDKRALLPGETAQFANYTSYSRGINGVMIDVAGLLGEVSPADFRFRVGNTNASSTWATASAPASVSVRRGAGLNGADRVTIVWPDAVIYNQWLEVTLRSNATTGLPRDEVFYFGNAIGETGDSTSNALVNASDILAARDNPRGPLTLAAIDNPHDFNRDRLVTATDVILARDHVTSPFSALRRITPEVALAAVAAALPAFPVASPRDRDAALEEELSWLD
jgi:hypothetical protein